MKSFQLSLKGSVEFVVPETVRDTFLRICSEKGLSPEQAAAVMVYSACRNLEETPPHKGTDLLTDLNFARGLMEQNAARLDKLLGVAEKVVLDSQGIHAALRNRAFGGEG